MNLAVLCCESRVLNACIFGTACSPDIEEDERAFISINAGDCINDHENYYYFHVMVIHRMG